MFNDAHTSIGIFPITSELIEKRAWKNEDAHRDSSDNKFNGKNYEYARDDLIYDVLTEEFHMPDNEIFINKNWMCTNPQKGKILWFKTTRNLISKLFYQAASIKNKTFKIIPFAPGPAINRKKKIDLMLKEKRPMYPQLRTQVRLGSTDFNVVTKNMDDEYPRYRELSLKELYPNNTLPKIKIKEDNLDDPKQKAFIKSTVEKAITIDE